MTNKELEKYILKQGFKDVGGDGEGEMYITDDICIFLLRRGNKRTLSFGHSTDGYYDLENPTIQQIKFIISIFKKAELIPAEMGKIPKRQFHLTILELMKDYVQKQEEAEK